MTSEEAISILKAASYMSEKTTYGEYKEAVNMAISALKAQTDGDTISRQDAIDAILAVTGNSSVRELYEHVQEHGLSEMWSGGVSAAIDVIIAVPSAQPEHFADVGNMDDGELDFVQKHEKIPVELRVSAQPKTCEDAVSRQTLQKELALYPIDDVTSEDEAGYNRAINDVQKMVLHLPSAQPDNRLSKIADLVEGTIDHFDLDDAMDLLYQIKDVLDGSDELPSAQPDRSLWFRIGEICVDESKGFISAGKAFEKIRELLREAERLKE